MTDTTDTAEDRDPRVVEFEKDVNDAVVRLATKVLDYDKGFDDAAKEVVTIATWRYADATVQRDIAERNADRARKYVDRFRNAIANAVATGRTNTDGLLAGERSAVVDVANLFRCACRMGTSTSSVAETDMAGGAMHDASLVSDGPKAEFQLPADVILTHLTLGAPTPDPARGELAIMEGLVDLAKADPSAPSRVARWALDRFVPAKVAD